MCGCWAETETMESTPWMPPICLSTPGPLFSLCSPQSLMSAAGGRPWEGVVLLKPFLARLLP